MWADIFFYFCTFLLGGTFGYVLHKTKHDRIVAKLIYERIRGSEPMWPQSMPAPMAGSSGVTSPPKVVPPLPTDMTAKEFEKWLQNRKNRI